VPDQAVLVDLANRRFYFFFLEIWPQEFFYVAGLLIMAGVGLFLLTSTVGRAWCGYTCPQTIWVDLFLVVERTIEGDRNARIKLDKAAWSADKIVKRVSKHSLWLLISVMTGGAWIFYFADAPILAVNFVKFEAPFIAYSTVGVLTATTYVFAGIMREQICTYMCPWPRIQAAMLDEDSLVVTYNDWRGEPRSRHIKAERNKAGDCIDCNQCVAVCPMGIDIRDGQQLECITCALCIDACNDVMDKVDRPRGLIGYSTLKQYGAGVDARGITWRTILRPRTVIYTGIWVLAGLAMLFALITRDTLDINVLHDRNPLYVQLSDGAIRNGYTVKLLNMRTAPRQFTLSVSGLPKAVMTMSGAAASSLSAYRLDVAANKLRTVKVFLRMRPEDLPEQRTAFQFVLSDRSGDKVRYDAFFLRPANIE
jgi:cytochrome c oxidase accessory protein FixG